MLLTCPHCTMEFKYSPQGPITVVVHISACKQAAAEKAISKQPTHASYQSSKGARQGGMKEDVTRLCPVCRQDVIDLPKLIRMNHFNSCWAVLSARTTMHKIYAITDAPEAMVTRPSSTPNLPQSIPVPIGKVNVPDTSCLTCGRNLSSYSALDALHHRAICFANQPELSCPICKIELFDSTGLLQSSLLHMQRCQRGTQSNNSATEAKEFEILYVSLCGRTEISNQFYRRTEGKSRNRTTFMQKIQKKRNHVDLVYECGESPLRHCVSQDGEEVESWRTAGNAGKAARNLFPVVREDFDPFITIEDGSSPKT